MTLHEALDKCTICDLFNKNVSDEYKMQVIDKVVSAPNTKAPKVKLCNIITWLLKKVKWQEQQIEQMRCCENCKYNSYWGNELHCNYGLKEALKEDKLVECNKMDKWEIKEK